MKETNMMKLLEMLTERVAALEAELEMTEFWKEEYRKERDKLEATLAEKERMLASVQHYIDNMKENCDG